MLGERAAWPFGEHSDFGAQFVSRSVVVFRFAVFVEPFVFGDDAGDSFAFVNELCAAKLREEVHAGFFDKAAQPFYQAIEGDNVIAFVLEWRRSDGKAERRVFGEKQSGIVGYRSVQWSALLEIGDEFGEGFRVHDRARKLVRSDLAPLLEDVDIFRGKCGAAGGSGGFVVLLDKVGEMEGAGQAGGTGANDQDVCLKSLALFGHRFLV